MNPVRIIYNFLLLVSWWVLQILARFSTKIRLFVAGRRNAKKILRSNPLAGNRCIWMHVASLGEYEQGLPILEKLKSSYPNHKLVLTFFSPSGYEIKKNTAIADLVLYLPMDTSWNVNLFLNTLKPELALFIKYEIWPNYLHQLKRRKIPTLLISAIFSNKQVFFKPWGGFMRKSLKAITHFFLQDSNSQELLNGIGFNNTTVSGDTRFDRVSEILKRDNQLNFMENFKKEGLCLVAGSTWPEDEEILIDYINNTPENLKFVLAPHTIKPSHISKIKNGITKKSICYSALQNEDLSKMQVLIIDTIGLLTKIYSYADIAYVGGAFATGLHNTLEPAVYGVPVLIGPDYHGFKEAEELVENKGILVIKDRTGFESTMNLLVSNSNFRRGTGKINSNYIKENVGATEDVMALVKTIL